jgi:putative tryptophan/tyrosine transport system substrate-binding protein
MRRRDFISLLGGAVVGRPFAAQAQQTGKVSRIGYLGASSVSLERRDLDAFRQTLRDLGHVEGDNITIEYRWAEGDDGRLPALAVELVRLKVDVIVTLGTPGTLAAKQATNTIPIVCASFGNPVESGLVASYARPGGNVTGFTGSPPELETKRLQILKDVVPRLSRVAVMWNSTNTGVVAYYRQLQAAAAALGVMLQPVVEVGRVDDFERAFSTIGGARSDALVVVADRFLLAHRKEIVAFAATNRLPGMYPYQQFVNAGGLLSYAPSDIDQFRRTAIYVDKILRGTKPADLPVQDSTKYELAINLNTAKALGLEVPFHIQELADDVIE